MSYRIGFIGVGTISAAMIRGLLREDSQDFQIVVSPRNAEVAAQLAQEFAQVTIATDNQAVIDVSDTVVLAVRPQIAAEVIPALLFRDGQTVISVIATLTRLQLLAWIPANITLAQAVPLPFVEECRGATAVYPNEPDTLRLFNRLGQAVGCDTVKEYNLLAVASAMMASYFGMMGDIQQWLVQAGLPDASARTYISSLFSELAHVAEKNQHVDFEDLVEAHSTKGGLNEQACQVFRQQGGTAALHAALAVIQQRIGDD
ncbi:pyrroline-5-carboxylate reductase [Acinetobacter baumannii]